MKIIKWLLAAVLLTIIGVVVYITLIFNPNDFKPEIVKVVKEQTGRELQINKDLSWSFFPTLGINIADVSFSNPAGMKPAQMLMVKDVVAEVA